MSSQLHTKIYVLLLTVIIGETQNISLPQREARILELPVNSSIVINPVGLSVDTAYILCQAHTQTGNITLSLENDIKYGTSVSGRDIGVVSMVTNMSNITWYLYSNSSADIQVLVHLTYFTNTDPLVGGCNEEFSLENDPNIHLNVQSTKTTVDFEWSNTGVDPSTETYPACEDSVFQSDLEYHIYVKYLEADDFDEEEYFRVIKQMLAAEDITKHATWLNKFSSKGHKSDIDLSSYSHRGVVYNTVVKFNKDGIRTQAAYIPVVSYGCDIARKNTCKQRDVVSLVLSTIGGLIGLFLCFFGHRFFKTENFLFGFLIFGLVFYQVLALSANISFAGTLALAAIFGLIGGAMLLGLWWYHGIPVLNVLFIGLVTGYLISSILFYTPFGNLSYLQSPFNYGATFACGVLVVPVILLFFTRFLNIFSCAMIGSFTFVLMIDMYMHSALYATVLNSIRHGTDRQYVTVTITAPYTYHEISLTIVWGILIVLGTGFQLFRERKKAPFPPCPRHVQDRIKNLRGLLRSPSTHLPPENENEPLIRGGNSRHYGTTQNASLLEDDTVSTEEENRPEVI